MYNILSILTQTLFRLKYILNPNFLDTSSFQTYQTKNVFNPKFFNPNFFSTKNFFEPENVLIKKMFEGKPDCFEYNKPYKRKHIFLPTKGVLQFFVNPCWV